MGKEETISFYDKLRQKNLLEKQEMMKKLGMSVPTPKPPRSKSPSPVPAKRGRLSKKPPPRESSDEDYEYNEEDKLDEEWEDGPSKKRRKRENRAPTKATIQWNNSSMVVKTVTNKRKSGRYPKRDNVPPKYEDEYTPGTDDMLYCADCKVEWEGDCPEHGPLLVIEDTKIPPNINDRSRAKKTAPSMITVADSKIPDAGSGVWARDYIPARVRFGPYDGKRVFHNVRNPYTWLIRKKGKPYYCVDATEPGLSNWMRFVNCARYDGEQNLEAFQFGGNIYYRTIRRVAPHEELLVWYGDDYGRQLGIDPEMCDAEDQEKWKEMRFRCTGCEFSYISPLYLERHKKVCRQLKAIENSGQTYQCQGCKLLYSDAEYLRRHARFCRKLQQSAYSFTGGRRGRCDSKAQTERSTVQTKESLESDRCESDLPVKDKVERRPSSSLNVNQSEIYQHSNESAPENRKQSTRSQPNVATGFEPESLPEKPSNIESDYAQSESPSQMPEVSISCSAVGRAELRKIDQAYVRLERIPWFSDVRAAEKPYLCTDCNERFCGKDDLDSHISQHRLNTLLVCPVTKCNKTFCVESRVWKHVGVHFDGGPVAPTVAPSEKKESVNGDVPKGLKFFVCRKCYKFFGEREHLWNHQCIHLSIQTGHGCSDGKMHSDCTSLENPSEVKIHTCFECKESFKSLEHLTLHLVSHRAGCRFVAKLQSQLPWSEGQDLQSFLVNGETASLSERIAQFSLTYSLLTTVSVQRGHELFSTQSSLPLSKESDSKRIKHSITFNKKSERSDRQLPISASLKNYLNSIKGVFVCSTCNSKFSQESTLIIHRRTHNIKKPFICKVCKESFLHRVSIQRHISSHASDL